MNPSAFEDLVLEFVADDYEAPHTIAGDISKEVGRTVLETEVRTALLALADRGRVQAYRFDTVQYRYVPITSTQASRDADAWFKSESGEREEDPAS